jgi:hypothetical protein
MHDSYCLIIPFHSDVVKLTFRSLSYYFSKKGSPVHIAPACARSMKGFNHFESYVGSISLYFFEEITAREAPAVVLLLKYIEKVHKKKNCTKTQPREHRRKKQKLLSVQLKQSRKRLLLVRLHSIGLQ